ncbi:MAG: tetratricopeptide repeat protein [Lentisphaerae bacterium]|nr:tetratricopeptide repeat protein [Lentisphaerota bacterium]MCP4101872.1 tetratricopeptide repeat protein [Lentisphaerota bacterium]
MPTKFKKNFSVVLITLIVALLARVILFIFWLDNPLRYYDKVNGLDMQTLVGLGERLYNGSTIFTLHKFALAVFMWLNHGVPLPDGVIVLQLIMGIVTAGLTSWCVLRLKGDRTWAVMSGILAALYAPAMMYQVVVLKETFMTFFAFLAFAAILWSHRKHFSGISLYTVGILLALPCLCRVTALPFVGLGGVWLLAVIFKKFYSGKNISKIAIKTLIIALGVVSIFIPASVLNYRLTGGQQILPFNFNIRYAFNLGCNENVKTLSVKAAPSAPDKSSNFLAKVTGFGSNFVKKVPLAFQAREIPNNLNYYFIKPLLPPLNYMIGPLLLLPLSVAGLFMVLFSRKCIRKEGILLVFIFAYLLPICFFYPLGRYRLVFYPVFCILAPYPLLYAIDKWRSKNSRDRIFISVPVLLYLIIFILSYPRGVFIRTSDYVSHGKAALAGSKKPVKGLPYFLTAYKMSPNNQSAVVNLVETLLRIDKPKEALAVAYKAHMNNPENNAFKYYSARLLLINKQYSQSEAVLNKLDPNSMGPLKIQYFYMLGQSLRQQGKYSKALKNYKKALAANPTTAQRELIERLISSLTIKADN